MKRISRKARLFIPLTLVAVLIASCEEKKEVDPYREEFESLQADNMEWWTYHNRSIDLSSEFLARNEENEKISKKAFLEQLTTGKFIPLKVSSEDSSAVYKLYTLTPEATEEIAPTIKNTSRTEYRHFLMEGKELPEFEFQDLNGNSLSSEDTKGKNLIVKTWFINCKPCIAEFPELNEYVEEKKDREDLLFLSLALDSEEDLKKFLAEKEFKYAVVADQKSYIQDSLGLSAYPTHLIVDKNGVILKVVNKAEKMMAFADEKIYQPEMEKAAAPPPPPPPPPGG